LTPFDYAKSIDTREYIDDLSDYFPLIINKKLSLSAATILYANEMNINHGIDNKLQYDYLYHAIRPNKRRPFIPWLKAEKASADIQAIQEYYGYNSQKAHQALSILTSAQIETIKEKLIRGGI